MATPGNTNILKKVGITWKSKECKSIEIKLTTMCQNTKKREINIPTQTPEWTRIAELWFNRHLAAGTLGRCTFKSFDELLQSNADNAWGAARRHISGK